MDTVQLHVMIQIIDTCAERGSFKGEELLSVGTLREEIIKELKSRETEETEKG